ncbi:MAG: hypothetical protein GY720_08470 [bacterium]|nr:hypothetical protein [bacterium]
MRVAGLLTAVALLLTSCGSAELTITEYAEEVETVVHEMATRFESLDTSWEAQSPSLAGATEYWVGRLEIREWFLDAIGQIDPPDGLTEMHDDSMAVFTRITEADEALAARVATMTEVTEHREWLATPEGEASLAVLEEVYAFCRSSQSEFDATEDRAALEGVAWVPPEMKEIVKVAFGCPPQEDSD